MDKCRKSLVKLGAIVSCAVCFKLANIPYEFSDCLHIVCSHCKHKLVELTCPQCHVQSTLPMAKIHDAYLLAALHFLRSFADTEEPLNEASVTAALEKMVAQRKFVDLPINQGNIRGETALHVASMLGILPKVKALIANGADLNAQAHAGWTPLHEAGIRGHAAVAACLLEAGAEVSIRGGPAFITPLHGAVQLDHLGVARVMLRFGADREARDKNGSTPEDYAGSKRMKDLVGQWKDTETPTPTKHV